MDSDGEGSLRNGANAAHHDNSDEFDSLSSSTSSQTGSSESAFYSDDNSDDNNDEDEDVDEQGALLRSWLVHIVMVTAQWGLVVNPSDELSSQPRMCYGVVVELTVRTPASFSTHERTNPTNHMTTLREAITLVHLLLATNPMRLKNVFNRATAVDEELQALSRGVPFELRVRLEFMSSKIRHTEYECTAEGLLDHAAALPSSNNTAYVALRHELVASARSNGRAHLLKRVFQSIVPVVVAVHWHGNEMDHTNLVDSNDFLILLTEFAASLHSNNQRLDSTTTQWSVDTQHAPLVVEKLELTVRGLSITPLVIQSAATLFDVGLPIDCVELSIDPRLISCTEDELCGFVQMLTRSAAHVDVDIMTDTYAHPEARLDSYRHDHSALITMVIRAIAGIAKLRELNFGSLFKLFGNRGNRDVIIRGLFDLILSRTEPLETLVCDTDFALEQEDVHFMQGYGTQWRNENPDKKLRVKAFSITLDEVERVPVRELLAAFDDVEVVSVYDNGSSEHASTIELALQVLQFPSLRILSLENIAVESMDLFDPSVADARVPRKPVLEELALHRAELEDASSLRRFFQQLKCDPRAPTGLASTLQCFTFHQDEDAGSLFDSAMMEVMQESLHTNRVLRQVSNLYNLRRDWARYNRLDLGCHLPAPLATRQSAVVRARNVAFLSVIRAPETSGQASSARWRLDASVVRLVLDLSAPHVYRKVQISDVR